MCAGKGPFLRTSEEEGVIAWGGSGARKDVEVAAPAWVKRNWPRTPDPPRGAWLGGKTSVSAGDGGAWDQVIVVPCGANWCHRSSDPEADGEGGGDSRETTTTDNGSHNGENYMSL